MQFPFIRDEEKFLLLYESPYSNHCFFSPILGSVWMFVFHVNHMAVRLVSNLCNFPSVPCLKIKTFFVTNFTSLKLKYSLQSRSDYLKWPVCSFHYHIQLHNSSHQQSHCIWNMQAVEAGIGSFVEGMQNSFFKVQFYKRHLHTLTRKI